MKLRLKEDPREWRKSVLLTLLGLALLTLLLRWRKAIGVHSWLELLATFAACALLATFVPQWFRGYYRISMRAGFASSQVVARVVLILIFGLVITPVALLFRIAGKDGLHLKRRMKAESYWSDAKSKQDLDRMF